MSGNIKLILAEQQGSAWNWQTVLSMPTKAKPVYFTLGNIRYRLRVENRGERRQRMRRDSPTKGRREGDQS